MKYTMAYVFEHLNTLGIDDARMIETIAAGKGLAVSFSYEPYEIELIDVPLADTLKAGEAIEIAVRIPGVSDGAFINNGDFVYLDNDGDLFTGSIVPRRGKLKLSFRLNHKNRNSFWPIFEYNVR